MAAGRAWDGPHGGCRQGAAGGGRSDGQTATRGDWEGLPDRAGLALLDHGPGGTVR
ncbi:hypothetical protein [Micromonospora sp. NBC_00617]|uniref:hypothetical protein n=1 Tax=Micromonospora sp. NBC_00617 TaxID=2903587 RepID=UPI0030DF1528